MADVSISTLDGEGSFKGYRADPAGTPKAAIIVLQEIFGVNPGIRKKCDDWAAQGYLALAPDLFWRLEPGIELDPDQPEQMQRGFDLFGQFDQDKGIQDIEATIRYIRGQAGVGKVGCVGFCLGGRLAFMTATRTDIDASVGYYGVGIDGLLSESHAIANPVLLHVPTADGFVSPEAQQAMHEGLKDNRHVSLIDYPGLDHGFADELGKRRNPAGAEKADAATRQFFARHLG